VLLKKCIFEIRFFCFAINSCVSLRFFLRQKPRLFVLDAENNLFDFLTEIKKEKGSFFIKTHFILERTLEKLLTNLYT